MRHLARELQRGDKAPVEALPLHEIEAEAHDAHEGRREGHAHADEHQHQQDARTSTATG
jgi:hypothetical protein